MSEELANLSNDEIRVRLLEYGFQNLPVTQTTRKVLIKKLSHAMEAQKTKTRRETVAVIKSSDDEDVDEAKRSAKRERTPNRRATIAAVEKTKKVPATSSSSNGSGSRAETPSKTSAASSRRSSRATPQKMLISSTALQEDSDDNDVIEVPLTRRSKTPTMGKSETVRTSYKSTIEKITEPVIEVVEEEQDEDDLPLLRSQRSTSRRKTFAAPEIIEKPTIARTATPTKMGRSTLTTSFNPSAGSYSFNPPVVSAITKPTLSYDRDDDDYTLDDAPYLSNFAKRLSTLKAEPIDVGLNKYKSLRSDDDEYGGGAGSKKYESTVSYRYSQYQQPQTTQHYGAPTSVKQRGVVNQMARDFDKLDRKYSVRKYVYIALLIMVVIAIYVLLFA